MSFAKEWKAVLRASVALGAVICTGACTTVEDVARSVCAKKAEAEAVAKAAIEYMNEHCALETPTPETTE